MTYKYTTSLNKLRIQKILDMCQRQQINAYDIADTLNIRTDIARGFIRYMLEEKLIYVSEYKIFGKAWTRYYMAGNKPNAVHDEYMEHYYMTSKQKKALADAKRYKRNQETLKQERSKKIRPDIASAWMFNPC